MKIHAVIGEGSIVCLQEYIVDYYLSCQAKKIVIRIKKKDGGFFPTCSNGPVAIENY